MPAGPQGGGPPSMLQGLQGVLGELGSMMAAPDADPRFLVQLQMVITGKIRQGTQQAIGGGRPGMGGPGMPPQQIGPGGGGGMSGFGGAAPAMAGAGGPGGPPGGAGQPMGAGAGQPGGAPNPDELRRVLGAQGVTQ
jgi:hypothetical protein